MFINIGVNVEHTFQKTSRIDNLWIDKSVKNNEKRYLQ